MGLLSTKPQPPPDPGPDEPLFVPERSGVQKEAFRHLREADIPADEIVHVDRDSILFRYAGRCKTAWMRWNGALLIVVDESDWRAEPSAWARAQLDAQTVTKS